MSMVLFNDVVDNVGMQIYYDHHQMMITTVLQHTQAVEVVATSIVMEVGDYILVSPS